MKRCQRRTAASFRALMIVILTVIGVMGATGGTVSASQSPLLKGSSWMGGKGVNVCAPGTDPVCGGQAHVGGVSSNWWQCVELAQRLYRHLGWYGGVFSKVGVATDIYSQAANLGMSRQANGGVRSIAPGDMIVTAGSRYDGSPRVEPVVPSHAPYN